MTMIYQPESGSKPRYDNGGSEFGRIHRELPSSFTMFDIDRLQASFSGTIKLRRENEGFVEYRHVTDTDIKFVALFEIKAHKTVSTLKALDSTSTVGLARLRMAQLLGCRLFVVYGIYNKQPFDFYEINTFSGENKLIGTLRYENGNAKKSVEDFWFNVLGITE